MRGVVRAAAYLPHGTDGRRRVRSWDEDAFTMAAAAIEKLLTSRGAPPSAWVVRPVGELRGLAPELFAGVLGASVTFAPSPDPAGSPLGDALARADQASGLELLVGAVEDPLVSPTAPRPAPGEGAFALLVDELPSSVASLVPPTTAPPPGHELAELFPLATKARGPALDGWVGDWAANPREGRSPPAHAPGGAPPAAVSEGAYVPRASYLDAIASRWRFVGDRCRSCSTLSFPARGRCRRCGRADQLTAEPLPRDDLRIAAATWIGAGGQPTEFDEQVAATGPYGVALVELAEGIHATVALTDTDPDDARVGRRVDTVLRRLYALEGAWRYGRKGVARPPRADRQVPG